MPISVAVSMRRESSRSLRARSAAGISDGTRQHVFLRSDICLAISSGINSTQIASSLSRIFLWIVV